MTYYTIDHEESVTMKPVLSLIICTRNRSSVVQTTLIGIIEQIRSLPHDDNVEIIVVDNGSTDNTKHVIRKLQKKYGTRSVLYIFESKKGVSFARNTGVRKSRGNTVTFIDDDTHIASQWLVTVLRLLKRNPTIDIIAGRILLPARLKTHPVIRFLNQYDSLWSIGVYDLGQQACRIPKKYLLLLNTAVVRKRVFDRIGMFDTRFGTSETNEVFGGEDVDFTHRALTSGATGVYNPVLKAYHNILPYKLTWKYLSWRYYMNGKEMALFTDKHHTAWYPRFYYAILRLYYIVITHMLWPFLDAASIERFSRWCHLRLSFISGFTNGSIQKFETNL